MPVYNKNSAEYVKYMALQVISTALDTVSISAENRTAILRMCRYEAEFFMRGDNEKDSDDFDN